MLVTGVIESAAIYHLWGAVCECIFWRGNQPKISFKNSTYQWALLSPADFFNEYFQTPYDMSIE